MWQIIGRLQQTYEVPVNDRRLQGAITGIIQNTEPQMQGLTLPEQIDRLVQFCEGELQNQKFISIKTDVAKPIQRV